MSRKLFTKEEVLALRASPYVESVTARAVAFTPEFKRIAYDEILTGKFMRKIFAENGIDPSVLGDTRINGFREKLLKNADREAGFENLRKNNYRRPAQSREATLEARVEQLENELVYTKQVVEFLKKIQQADMEARKSWGSKHRLK